MNDKEFDVPLSQSSVSLKLEMIQRRCHELMDEQGAELELTLDEPAPAAGNSGDPYNRQS